jgi:D-psicose/D-tagatose/L-ribulose 3-epimerase
MSPPTTDRSFYLSFFLFTTDPQPGDPIARERLIGQIEELVAMGYSGFELPIPPGDPAAAAAEIEAYRNLRDQLDQRGLATVALTTNVAATAAFDPSSEDPAVREAALRYLRSRVEITAALRGKVMMGPIIFPYGLRPLAPDGQPLWSDALQSWLGDGYLRAAGVLAELADHAASLDVRLAIEPISHWETAAPNTLEQLQDFLELVANPFLGVVIDSAHEVLDGAGPERFAEQVAALAAAGRLHYVQLSAPDRGRLDRSWLPWGSFLERILPHYQGPLAIEMFNALPVFQPLLRLSRRKYWIAGVDAPSDAASAMQAAQASLQASRQALDAALIQLQHHA